MAFLVSSAAGCVRTGSGFTWGYRTCHKNSQECLDYSAAFKDQEACESYIERISHRCIGGKYLKDIEMETAVCWRTEPMLSRSECNKL